LAGAGFVVAAINHPGDNGGDSSQRDSLSVLASRPTDLIRLFGFMLHDCKDREAIGYAKSAFSESPLAPIPDWCWRGQSRFPHDRALLYGVG
jgi:hypothetical protein